jgi:hypothetical protein
MAEARQWTVGPDPDTGEVDEQALNEALFEAGVFLKRGGGGIIARAHRLRNPEIPSELYTESVTFQWLARSDTKPRAEEPSAEPVAVAAAPELEREPDPDPVAA